MCRMSSKDKINVQDLSKERGVSDLDMSEEKESGTGKFAQPRILHLVNLDLTNHAHWPPLQKAPLFPVQTQRAGPHPPLVLLRRYKSSQPHISLIKLPT